MATPANTNNPVIGIDLGGTHMQIGIVDHTNALIARDRTHTNAKDGCDAVIERIIEAVNTLCDSASIPLKSVAGLGIAAPGAIDIPNGIILEAPNLDWRNTPLRDILEQRLNCRVTLDNDVNGAVWGEYRLGAGRSATDLLAVWVGTGVGGGLIFNHELHHGAFHTAGEIGQTIITPDGTTGFRTVEDHCSRTGMSRAARARLADHPNSILHERINEHTGIIPSQAWADALAHNDTLARTIIDRAAHLLGIAIANWVTMLAIDRIVIGGGITETLGEPFIEKVRTAMRDNVFPARCREADLRMTELQADAGLLGAAMLARDAVM